MELSRQGDGSGCWTTDGCQWLTTGGVSVGIDVAGVDGAGAVLDFVGQDGVAVGGDGEESGVLSVRCGTGGRS